MKELFQYKILLIEDGQKSAASLLLNKAGYQIDSLCSGKEAIQMLQKKEHGLIILDLESPEMTMDRVARIILENSKTNIIPFIFLSSHPFMDRFLKKCPKTGNFDCLVKPVDGNLLLLKVKNSLSLHHSSVKLKNANDTLQKNAVEAKISYEDLYFSLSQHIFIINREGIIVNINRTGILCCGQNSKELLNHHYLKSPFLRKIFDNKDSREKFKCFFEETICKKQIEFQFGKPDKTVFYGEALISMALIDGKNHIQIAVSDITEKTKSKEILKLNSKEISNSEKINQAILQGDSINQISGLLLNAFREIAGVNSSRIYLYDAKINKLNLIGQAISNNVISGLELKTGIKLSTLEPPLLAGTLFKQIIDQKQNLITSDASVIKKLLAEHTDNLIIKQMAGWARKFMNVKTAGVLSIMYGDSVLGLITFTSGQIMTEEEKQSVLRFLKQAATLLAIKKNELALTESEERFELAMQGANDGLWDWNLLTNEVYFSPRWKSMLGYAVNELEDNVGSWGNLLHKDDKDRAFNVLQQYFNGSISEYNIEFRMQHKNGQYVDILARGQSVRDSSGQLCRMLGTHVDISARKIAEIEIETSQKLFSNLFYKNPVINAITDVVTGKYIQVNDNFVEFFGLTKEEIIGKTSLELNPILHAAQRAKRISTIADNIHVKDLLVEVKIQNGQSKWLSATSQVFTINGKECFLTAMIDITERKKTEEEIINQKKFTEDILNNVPADIAVFDTDHNYNFINSNAVRDPEIRNWMIGKNDFDYCKLKGSDISIADKRRLLFEETTKTKSKVEWIEENVTENGEIKLMLRTFQPFLENNEIKYIIGHGTDVTKREQTKNLLNQSKQQVESLLSNMNDGFIADDISGKVTFFNQRFLEIFGLQHTDIKNLVLEDYVSPEYHEMTRERHNRRVAGEKVEDSFEYEGLRKDGKKIWLEVHVSPIVENKIIKGTQSVIRDITEKKNKEIEFKKLAELNSKIIDSSDEIFYVVEIKDKKSFTNPMIYISDKTEKMFGVSPDFILKNPDFWFNAIHPDDRNQMKESTKRMFATKMPVSRVYRSKHFVSGEYIWLVDFVKPDLNAAGEVQELFGSTKNITELKSNESQLKLVVKELNDKNNELMQFNYIVSHNLRAPIAQILGLANIINMPNITAEEKPKIFEFIKTAAGKMDELVKDLNVILAARSPLNAKKENVSLPSLIQSISDTLESQISESNCVIEIDLADDAKELITIKSYMESILYNLVNNAIKYKMPTRTPQLTISTKKLNDNILIMVSDNGRGVDMTKHGEEIFGLYKRFHMDIEGKGIGLHMTKTQVEALGGKIEIESIQNEGTTFKITLPV